MESSLETTIGELVANKRSLISVSDTATIKEVLSTLVVNNITAVPVEGSAVAEQPKGRLYIGIVSILDIVLHMAENLDRADKDLEALAVNIIGQSSESRTMCTLSSSTKLKNALEPLCSGVHRILVQSDGLTGQEISGDFPQFQLLTQSDVATFLLQHSDVLESIGQHTLGSLGLINVGLPPISVPSNMLLIDVLRLMSQDGDLTAVAVVGAMDGIIINSQPRPVRGGNIISSLSTNNFRGLNVETLKDLFTLTVEEFLKRTSEGLKPPVTCRPTTTLSCAMASILSHGVHRTWVANEDGWITGVVSFNDFIELVLKTSQSVPN